MTVWNSLKPEMKNQLPSCTVCDGETKGSGIESPNCGLTHFNKFISS